MGKVWKQGLIVGCLVGVLSLPYNAGARDLFEVTATTNPGQVNEISTNTGLSNAEDAIRQMDSNQLSNLINSYNVITPALATIDFRGLLLNVSFPNAGTSLNLDIPSLKIYQQFTGATRDDSVDALVDFFQSEGGSLLNDIQKKLAAVSPVDPIAGNPNSLQASLIADAFTQNAFDTSDAVMAKTDGSDANNVLKIGVSGGKFSSGDIDGTSIAIPLGYTVRFDSNPEWQLKMSMPLQMVKVGDSDIYNVGFGVSLRMPVSKDWAISPGISWGVAGSIDAASAAQMVSYSVTSQYRLPVSSMNLILGNMIGQTQTLGFKVGDYDIDPDISNTIFRNGLQAEFPTQIKVFGAACSTQLSFVNTTFSGDDLYLDSYNDIAISFGKQRIERECLTNHLRAGVTYTFGADYDAVKFNLGYSF